MPNEQTSVPLFASGEVLTSANMNISAGTGVPVFTNTTTRDAAFGGAGEKVLAEGQLCYLSSTNVVQYYDGAAWATVGPATAGGLVLVKTQTIGTTVGSVAVSDAFSATYENYKIIVTGGVGSTANYFDMILTGSTTQYNNKFIYGTPANNSITGLGNSAGTKWQYVGSFSTTAQSMDMSIYNPFLAVQTSFSLNFTDTAYDPTSAYGTNAGVHGAATSYTGFTLSTQAGTLTGGTIRVYGYANS
jgi:hypothetical protein